MTIGVSILVLNLQNAKNEGPAPRQGLARWAVIVHFIHKYVVLCNGKDENCLCVISVLSNCGSLTVDRASYIHIHVHITCCMQMYMTYLFAQVEFDLTSQKRDIIIV